MTWRGALVSRRAVVGLMALAAAGCSKLAFVAANVPAAFGPHKRHANLRFGAGAEHTLDVYVPEPKARPADRNLAEPTPAGQSTPLRPLVVFWYGGRWEDGNKNDYEFVGGALADLGYVVMLPNYRKYPEVKLAGFMADAAQAALWAVAHAAEYGADPQQLYFAGHSSGAHIAALLALDTRYLAAAAAAGADAGAAVRAAAGVPPIAGVPAVAGVIGLSGPYDFLPLTDDDLRDMFGPPENYPNSQPIHFVRRGAPPMLLIQGLGDRVVAVKNSVNLAAALRANDVPVTLKLYPKCGHADTVAALSVPARGREPTLADIAAFMPAPAARG
jgi:acetyl esterase/lipase